MKSSEVPATVQDLTDLENRLLSQLIHSEADVASYINEQFEQITSVFARTFDHLIETSDGKAQSAAQWREAFMAALQQEHLDSHWWHRLQTLFDFG